MATSHDALLISPPITRHVRVFCTHALDFLHKGIRILTAFICTTINTRKHA